MTSRLHSRTPTTVPAALAEATHEGARTARWRWLLAAPAVAGLVMLLALVAGGGAPEPVVPGLPDPGAVTGWGLPLSRLLFDLSAVAVIGALVTAVLLPAAGFSTTAVPALRAASWSAAVWALSSVSLLLLTVSDVLGVPPAQVFGSARFLEHGWQLAQGRSLLLVSACAVVLTAYTRWTRTRAGVAVLLVVAVGGVLPVLFAGHSAAASDHDLATSSLVVHVVAASVWVGGLGGVLLLLRRSPYVLAAVLPRYSTLALVCFAAVAFSGLLNAWIRTFGDLGLWAGSGYGGLLLLKTTGLVALGCFGWWHRRRTVTDVTAGRPRAFARLATAEIMVMAATIGAAVALSRTPPPVGALDDAPSHGFGHPTLGDDVEAFTLSRLVTEWRPEAVWLVLLAVMIGSYLAGVRRLRRDGRTWPRPRLTAAIAATVVALVATSGGLATYSTATFSLQVGQFLVLFLVVPTLVALSAPVTLLVRASSVHAPPSEEDPVWLRAVLRSRVMAWLLDPLNMLIVTTVMVFGLYATPLLEASLRSAGLHLVVNLATLAVGCLLWWSVLGIDPVPPPRPRAYRLWVLAGFLLLLGGIAARIYLSEVVLAGEWFAELDWSWVEMPASQRRGAGLMVGAVVVLGPVLAALTRTRASELPPVARQRR